MTGQTIVFFSIGIVYLRYEHTIVVYYCLN